MAENSLTEKDKAAWLRIAQQRLRMLRDLRGNETPQERRLEVLRPLLERLWQQMLAMGRPLVEEEVTSDLLSEIQQQVGSLRRAERLGRSQFDDQELITAGKLRREDLLVYFALNLFNGRVASASACLSTRSTASRMSIESALSLSGRLRVTRPTLPSAS